MIDSIEFKNFKALRHARLPLGRFTLIVGPNGSGKSTAIQALPKIAAPPTTNFSSIVTVTRPPTDLVDITVQWGAPYEGAISTTRWVRDGSVKEDHKGSDGRPISNRVTQVLLRTLTATRIYSLAGDAIAAPVKLQPKMELAPNGGQLAGVLDQLRDGEPERFEKLNQELGRWLPEFDRILFETPSAGVRAFLLRTRMGHHSIPAQDVSQGTLFALAILTLAYIPDPAPIVCVEEPDRGIHPRLLREVRDALYRLSYPDKFGEKREPVQVVATTHSPYFLDLYRDHPEEVVIAHKIGQEARFERLADREDLAEILGKATLGEVWYSGILGGVPVQE